MPIRNTTISPSTWAVIRSAITFAMSYRPCQASGFERIALLVARKPTRESLRSIAAKGPKASPRCPAAQHRDGPIISEREYSTCPIPNIRLDPQSMGVHRSITARVVARCGPAKLPDQPERRYSHERKVLDSDNRWN